MSDRAPKPRGTNALLGRLADIGATAQAAVPGLYAWSITVAPAAWSHLAPWLAKIAAGVGVLALVTAPLVEHTGPRDEMGSAEDDGDSSSIRDAAAIAKPRRFFGLSFGRPHKPWTARELARLWSVWGLVLSSAIVWVLVPSALSPAKLDTVRGMLGFVGWALFAFASAGPALKRSHEGLVVSADDKSLLSPRSPIPRGDGIYVGTGLALALSMQVLGWSITIAERAVLLRLVTVAAGIAVLGATTSISLARHGQRRRAPRRVGFRRALPWLVMLTLFTGSGLVLLFTR